MALDAKFWRDSAAEARAIAQRIDDPESRRILKQIANCYDDLAERAINILVVPAPRKNDSLG